MSVNQYSHALLGLQLPGSARPRFCIESMWSNYCRWKTDKQVHQQRLVPDKQLKNAYYKGIDVFFFFHELCVLKNIHMQYVLT